MKRRKEADMATPKTHDWEHDGEYCHHRHKDEEGAAARSVCEGMYAAKEDEKLRLKAALRAVYALAGENPEVRKIINEALDEDE